MILDFCGTMNFKTQLNFFCLNIEISNKAWSTHFRVKNDFDCPSNDYKEIIGALK